MSSIPEGKTVGELRALGFTAAQLYAASYDPATIVAVYSLSELVTSGIDISYIVSNKQGFAQLGGDIDGEAAGDQSGFSVSMNSAGTRVAIGARNNGGNGRKSGSTRVYEYNAGTWTKIGQDIDGEAAGDMSGESVSMNSTGSRVAISSAANSSYTGSTRVYEYNAGTNAWVKLGQHSRL